MIATLPLSASQEAVNEYSHLDPLSPVDLEQFAPQLPPELIDEADFDEYSDVGKLEAGDLMQFAYQIATGMVSNKSSTHFLHTYKARGLKGA